MSQRNPCRRRVTGILLVLSIVTSACSGAPESRDDPEWGTEAEAYFQQLAEVYRSNDFYGILDFYTPVAEIEKWRGDNRGGWPVPDLIKWNSADLGFDVVSLHLGSDASLNLVRWPSSDDVGAVVSDFVGNRIDHQVEFDLGASLERSLRATPATIRTYTEFSRDYAAAWSGGDPAEVAGLYADGATIDDGKTRGPVSFAQLVDTSPGAWELIEASYVFGREDFDDAPAMFLGPGEYGRDPERAVAIYTVTEPDGCERQVGVAWHFEGSVIVDEIRFHETVSSRLCGGGGPADGWWSGLGLPGPADQAISGQVQVSDGVTIEVRNGTNALVDLLVWGLDRFSRGALDPPTMDTVTFEPSRSCENRSGRVVDDGRVRHLYVCMFDSDVCTIAGTCATPGTSARIAMLHELAHAWMIDHVDDDTIEELLSVSGRSTWDDADVPWLDRGVEFSADVVAWGLLEEALPMVRLGAPPSDELERAFTIITGSPVPDR